MSLVDALNFSRKAIVQITIIEKLNLMISLSDYVINVHDIPSFNLRASLSKTKGCHLYAIDTSKTPITLCAAIKRKLLIFTWQNNEFVETKELAIPDVAKSLIWCGDSICIGFKREYNFIHVQTGAMSELFPTGKGGPLSTHLPNEQILLSRDSKCSPYYSRHMSIIHISHSVM